MSIITGFWRSRGGKIYLIALILIALGAFFLGYFTAKNETVPIVIEKTEIQKTK